MPAPGELVGRERTRRTSPNNDRVPHTIRRAFDPAGRHDATQVMVIRAGKVRLTAAARNPADIVIRCNSSGVYAARAEIAASV